MRAPPSCTPHAMIRSIVVALFAFLVTPSLLLCRAQDPAAQVAPQVQGEAEAQPAPVPEAPTTSGTRSWPPARETTKDLDPEAARRAAARQPPDGNWLVDAEGRFYFIEKRPKSLPYRRSGDARVRLDFGIDYDLAGEDDESLWLKVYRPSEEPVVRPPVSHVVTAEELAASAATFQAPALLAANRLHLGAFDAGLPTQGMWRNGFDLADLNGDGEIDFVHGPTRRGGDQPRVFLGDGHGKWRPYRAVVPPGLLDYGDVKVADFNGDGKADLASASHFRGVLVFVGDGAGNFSPWRQGLDFDAPRPGYDASGFSSRRIEVLDWNKDDRPDLLAFSEGPRMAMMKTGNVTKVASAGNGPEVFGPRLYLNQGDGTWVAVAETGSGQEIFGDDLAVADFDLNGRPDFLISSNKMGRNNLLYLQGKVAGGPWVAVELPLRPRAYVNAVAAADFDGDRRPDIALTYTSFELGVNRVGLDLYLNRRGGTWERRPVFAREGRVGLTAMDAGDLDGDKRQDLVATDHDGALFLFLGDGKGGFAREESPEAQQPRGSCRGYGLKVADLDRDGKPEIVATYAGEPNPLYAPDRCPGRGGVAAWTLGAAK